jgi:hypothetical protein
VLSPIVWNINFDEILKKLDQKPIKIVGFADDSVLLITGIDPSMMVGLIQPALNDIVAWGHESGLEFNASKTMVSWYTNKKLKINTLPRVKIGGISIDPVNEVKYLGMT